MCTILFFQCVITRAGASIDVRGNNENNNNFLGFIFFFWFKKKRKGKKKFPSKASSTEKTGGAWGGVCAHQLPQAASVVHFWGSRGPGLPPRGGVAACAAPGGGAGAAPGRAGCTCVCESVCGRAACACGREPGARGAALRFGGDGGVCTPPPFTAPPSWCSLQPRGAGGWLVPSGDPP